MITPETAYRLRQRGIIPYSPAVTREYSCERLAYIVKRQYEIMQEFEELDAEIEEMMKKELEEKA